MMANELTPQEKRIIQQYIFLPLIRLALERDKKVISITNTKFRANYIAIIDEAVHHVTGDIRKNRNDLFDHHIRMTKRNWLSYEACTRGRVFEIGYQKSIAGEWIYGRIGDYLKFS